MICDAAGYIGVPGVIREVGPEVSARVVSGRDGARCSVVGDGSSLSLTVAPKTVGSFTLLATNSAGNSSSIASARNTLQVVAPNGDTDGDGVTNAVETAIGSDPLNSQTSGAGISDGWQVFYGLNPLSASSAGPDPAKNGDTGLQDFQEGLSPISPNPDGSA